jgi:3-oxoacyl-[acyl-carrier protein] reductase
MIILTGASGGIGSEIAKELSLYDDLIGIYNKNKPTDSSFEAYQLDLNSEIEVNSFFEKIQSRSKKINLIHAAVINSSNLIAELSFDEFKTIINFNVNCVFNLNKVFLKKMMTDRYGRIIHFSSVAAEKGIVGSCAYSTSKTAILGMSKVISKEFGRFGITSNVINMGYFDTGLIKAIKPEILNKIVSSIPTRKLGNPNQITDLIKVVIENNYINGSVLNIDGGI